MGIIDFKDEIELVKRIEKSLKKRGLKIDKSKVWEIHGPHPDMNYQVCIGYAYKEADPKKKCVCPSKAYRMTYCKAHRDYICVAIYPRAVYQIEEPSKWWDTKPENRIFLL